VSQRDSGTSQRSPRPTRAVESREKVMRVYIYICMCVCVCVYLKLLLFAIERGCYVMHENEVAFSDFKSCTSIHH